MKDEIAHTHARQTDRQNGIVTRTFSQHMRERRGDPRPTFTDSTICVGVCLIRVGGGDGGEWFSHRRRPHPPELLNLQKNSLRKHLWHWGKADSLSPQEVYS